jgi:prepilin-type N-terminal cleavage/methylation domain-containing protein
MQSSIRGRGARLIRRLPRRAGFSLIEVMVAITVFSLVLLSLAKTTTALALRGRTNDLLAKRTAALDLEANKLGGVPYSSLVTWSTADQTITRGTFTYTRHLVITKAGTFTSLYSVKIVITPALDPSKPDSVVLSRTLAPTSTPLCITGC